jgi:bis(5'-nucleosyl)-tetraphosphatase (symmetrical)
MTTWIIGDLHGCWRTLDALLGRLDWSPRRDRIWLIGDLVNKGAGSLEVLRWAVSQSGAVDAVLGNHDLLLIAQADGAAPRREEDTLERVLDAPDADRLIGWLRTRPMLARVDDLVVVHAAVWPRWSMERAGREAAAVSRAVASPSRLAELYARRRTPWREGLEGIERTAAAAAVFTRLRMLDPDGVPRLTVTSHPDAAPDGLVPWYRSSRLLSDGVRMVFGHWAQLGLFREGPVTCIDSACVYGGPLTAMRAADGLLVQQPNAEKESGSEE